MSATGKGYYSFGFSPGERVPDIRVADVDGGRSTLAGFAGSTGAVFVIRDAECPVTQRYSPRLAELEREYGSKGYQFAYVDVTPHSRDSARVRGPGDGASSYGGTGVPAAH